MMDFDTVNQQLSGSPLWEGIKRDALKKVVDAVRLKLGVAPMPCPAKPTLSRREEAAALYREGKTHREIAAIMGITPGGVARMVYDARRAGVDCGPMRASFGVRR